MPVIRSETPLEASKARKLVLKNEISTLKVIPLASRLSASRSSVSRPSAGRSPASRLLTSRLSVSRLLSR